MNSKIDEFLEGIKISQEERQQITEETLLELSNNKGDDDE